MMNKILLLPILLALFGCQTKTVTKEVEVPGEPVEVPCGGYVMDGNWLTDVEVETITYDINNGEVRDAQTTRTPEVILSIFRTGCATQMLGAPFHSGAETLVLDTQYELPVTATFNQWLYVSMQGVCDLQDGCSVDTEFMTYKGNALMRHQSRHWLLSTPRPLDNPYAAVAPFEFMDPPEAL
jgi:hypothetical protein